MNPTSPSYSPTQTQTFSGCHNQFTAFLVLSNHFKAAVDTLCNENLINREKIEEAVFRSKQSQYSIGGYLLIINKTLQLIDQNGSIIFEEFSFPRFDIFNPCIAVDETSLTIYAIGGYQSNGVAVDVIQVWQFHDDTFTTGNVLTELEGWVLDKPRYGSMCMYYNGNISHDQYLIVISGMDSSSLHFGPKREWYQDVVMFRIPQNIAELITWESNNGIMSYFKPEPNESAVSISPNLIDSRLLIMTKYLYLFGGRSAISSTIDISRIDLDDVLYGISTSPVNVEQPIQLSQHTAQPLVDLISINDKQCLLIFAGQSYASRQPILPIQYNTMDTLCIDSQPRRLQTMYELDDIWYNFKISVQICYGNNSQLFQEEIYNYNEIIASQPYGNQWSAYSEHLSNEIKRQREEFGSIHVLSITKIQNEPPTNHTISCRTRSPTRSPTNYPTTSPTNYPTLSPILSDAVVYVRKQGCDNAYCTSTDVYDTMFCSNIALNDTNSTASACKTIKHSWNCFMGVYGGCERLYDGNGVFDIGEGTWNFPYSLNLYDNGIIIRGQAPQLTTWNYVGNDSIWIQCGWHTCWLSLQDLTIKTNRENMNDFQFYMVKGTLVVRNVIFDGNQYYAANNYSRFLWRFSGNRVNAFFEHCIFANNNVLYQFINGTNVHFSNCSFVGNHLFNQNAHNTTDVMFVIDGATALFENCIFKNNHQYNRALFAGQNHANILFVNTSFINNINQDQNTRIFYVDGMNANWLLSHCVFTNNYGYKEIIYITNNTNNTNIIIESTMFNNNVNIGYDLNIHQSSNVYLQISNSHFLNGIHYQQSILFSTSMRLSIKNTVWNNYSLSNNGRINSSHSTITFISFINAMMKIMNSSFHVSILDINSEKNMQLFDRLFNNITDNMTTSNTAGINGYGILNIGKGKWNIPYPLHLENNHVVIRGQKNKRSIFNYVGQETHPLWIKCISVHCSLSLQDLIISSNAIGSNYTQFYVVDSGSLFVKDVVFENTYHNKIWFLDHSNVVFRNCHFADNHTNYRFLSETTALFDQCVFEGDTSNSVTFYTYQSSVFYQHSIFLHNNELLFDINNESAVTFNDVSFIGNIHLYGRSHLIYVTGVTAKLIINASIFNDNYGQKDIVYVENNAIVRIESTIFYNNTNLYDYNMNSKSFAVNLRISNTTFMNGINHNKSIQIQGNLVDVVIDDCSWENYQSSQSIIAVISASSINSINITSCNIDNTLNTFVTCYNSINSLVNIHHAQFVNIHQGSYSFIFEGCNLMIDKESAKHNESVSFGHAIASTELHYVKLYLAGFTPENVDKKFSFINFGSNNGTVIFQPCIPPFNQFVMHDLTSSLINYYQNNVTFNYHYRESGDLFLAQLFCNNESSCNVACQQSLSCFQSEFYLNGSNKLYFLCGGINSCFETRINIYSSVYVYLLCDATSACHGSIVNIKNVDQFMIECIDKDSCLNMQLHVFNSQNVTIVCYEKNSCSSILINSSTENTHIYFYNYNENVFIYVPTISMETNLHCNPENAYLSLDSETYTGSLQQSVKNLFDGGEPCSDISFEFTSGTGKSCTTKYQYIPIYDVYFKNYMECYPPIYINDIITTIECVGTPNPSVDPTHTPTPDPTTSPTINPTSDPTSVPTKTPTRNPTTARMYDSKFRIKYAMYGLVFSNINKIIDISWNLERLIEKGYVDHLKNFGLTFEKFWIKILTINNYNIDIDRRSKRNLITTNKSTSVDLQSEIWCKELWCENIIQEMNKKELERKIQAQLQQYFKSNVTFILVNKPSTDDIEELYPSSWVSLENWKTNSFFVNGIFIILCLLYILIVTCIISGHNKRYYSLVIWSINVWLYLNVAIYSKVSLIIYGINVVQLIYMYFVYYRTKEYLRYIAVAEADDTEQNDKNNCKQSDGAGTSTDTHILNSLLSTTKQAVLNHTSIFACISVFGGTIPSLYVIRSNIYRLQIFNLSLSSRFIRTLFHDIWFMIIASINYIFLLIICMQLVFDDSYR
eukprot:203088_1